MKITKRKIVLICLSILCVFIFFRILGFIDINLYKSKCDSNQVASIGYSNKLINYDVRFEYNGKTIYRHLIIKSNQKRILIIVKINDFKYQGNYYLPFYKNFSMEYKCSFSNIKPKGNDMNKIDGKIDGSTKTEIKGICSIKQAKLISQTKAIESIKQYVIDSLSN